MFAVKLDRLPDVPAGKILILRTAPNAQVARAISVLRDAYPGARFGVLGTELGANPLFDGMERFELPAPWLSPRTFRPIEKQVRGARFDMAVLCLNSDCGTGYGKASRVMRAIGATFNLVAGSSGNWHVWEHSAFEEGTAVARWLVNIAGLAIYPLAIAALALTPSRPPYMPERQGRAAPRYES